MSHPDYKSDAVLGQKVREHLERVGLETPMTNRVNDAEELKLIAIRGAMETALQALGLDLTDDSLMVFRLFLEFDNCSLHPFRTTTGPDVK